MNTPTLLTDYETCPRKGVYSRSWERNKLSAGEMVSQAIRQALTATEQQDWGSLAGSAMMQLAEDRGLETNTLRVFDSVIHHAALVDLLVTSVRKSSDPAWLIPEPVQNWVSGCYLSADGNYLRRVVVASDWSDSRHDRECLSWFSLGEMAHYNLPMQMVILLIGRQRDGLRSSPWTTGFLHPANKTLRFRKRQRGTSEVFNERWQRILREEHAEIEREDWLEAMLRDDVLHEVCFREDIPIPPRPHLLRVRDLASTKLERIYSQTQKTPEVNLSSCDWPIACPYKRLCHHIPELVPEEKYGFIRLEELDRRSVQPSICGAGSV